MATITFLNTHKFVNHYKTKQQVLFNYYFIYIYIYIRIRFTFILDDNIIKLLTNSI